MSAPAERPQSVVEPIRVLVVAEVRLFREGLARELGREAGISIVDAAPAADALTRLASLRPDIVLADAATVRGAELVRRVAEAGAAVVAFAVAEENEEEVLACAEAGVAGIVARDASMEELLSALRATARGDVRCSPRVAALVMRRVARLASLRPPDGKGANLTRREREIAAFIDRGLSNKEIASALGIETATVKNHVHSLLEKLQVRRRGEVPSVLRADARVPGALENRLPRDRRI